MSEQKFLFKKKGPVCTLTMNAPEKMNALDREMLGALEATFNDISADGDSRVVVLEGAGGNFCSGADLSLLGSGITAEDAYKVMLRIGRLIKSIRELPQPVICKVHGVAYGGGANLALAGDFVVASHKARISQSFVNIGITLDCGGSYFLPRLVGMVRARALALLGEEIDGRTAAAMGLIYKSAAPDELDREVDALTTALARKSITALSVIKKSLNESFDMTLAEALDREAASQSIILQSEEFKRTLQTMLQSKKEKLFHK
jgi:2-(1,2-epoxy-1,2-dihydrophenyl)acetyl-CoA isomerase